MTQEANIVRNAEDFKHADAIEGRMRASVCELLEKADSVSDSIVRTMIQAHCLDMLLELEGVSK